ncbi:MAG TPA: acyl-CoA dehydrogenase family protein, partial [Acidimicrobiales bacterium]|nr:acyl-CoA dehydrogenase family protein [Acidimicrobiales bacterium]
MDLELSSEQEALRDEFRRMLTAVCDHDTRRAAIDSPGAVDRKLWEQLVNTGLFSLGLPEAQGGLGSGMAEMVIVHEEIGRAAVPGPVAVTSALAPHLPGVPDGSVIASALYEGDPPFIIEHLEG